jgi:hypothetical protein
MAGLNSVWPRLIAGTVVLAAVLVAAGPTGAVQQSPTEAKKAKSKQLVAAPAAELLNPAQAHYSGPASIQGAVTRLATETPLPDGGNFNGIRWDELDFSVTENNVRTLLQHNAACQWWRAAHDRREAGAADAIVADIPRWSGIRTTETAPVARKVAEQLPGGQGNELEAMLGECVAVQQRGSEYARARGLTVSR